MTKTSKKAGALALFAVLSVLPASVVLQTMINASEAGTTEKVFSAGMLVVIACVAKLTANLFAAANREHRRNGLHG
jgi:hypothetical protein